MRQESKNLLMVFMKNPVKGKVKTRLAATVGDDKALEIYKILLQQTATVVGEIQICDKAIFYADFIDKNDLWSKGEKQKYVQSGVDLGERMKNAFDVAFRMGYDKAIIIGTDCYDLNAEIIEEGFEKLNANDVVIGPAMDGGYYLIGMSCLHIELFERISWSTETVLADTLRILKQAQLIHHVLPIRTDVDTEENLYVGNNLKILHQL